MDINNIQLPGIGENAEGVQDVLVGGYSIKEILNVIIEFINKILKFEF